MPTSWSPRSVLLIRFYDGCLCRCKSTAFASQSWVAEFKWKQFQSSSQVYRESTAAFQCTRIYVMRERSCCWNCSWPVFLGITSTRGKASIHFTSFINADNDGPHGWSLKNALSNALGGDCIPSQALSAQNQASQAPLWPDWRYNFDDPLFHEPAFDSFSMQNSDSTSVHHVEQKFDDDTTIKDHVPFPSYESFDIRPHSLMSPSPHFELHNSQFFNDSPSDDSPSDDSPSDDSPSDDPPSNHPQQLNNISSVNSSFNHVSPTSSDVALDWANRECPNHSIATYIASPFAI